MLIALDTPHEEVEIGELLVVVTVYTANIVKDVRENLRNLVGGRLVHYEQLIQSALEQALADLETKAKDKGYDGDEPAKPIAVPNIEQTGAL